MFYINNFHDHKQVIDDSDMCLFLQIKYAFALSIVSTHRYLLLFHVHLISLLLALFMTGSLAGEVVFGVPLKSWHATTIDTPLSIVAFGRLLIMSSKDDTHKLFLPCCLHKIITQSG